MVIELPMFKNATGGIARTVELARQLSKKHDVQLRFQRDNPEIDYTKIDFGVPFSVGLPDSSFPATEVVITYSDNPFCNLLTELPQVKKVLIYMLSYGMCFERERRNVLNPKVTVMSSTTRTKTLIEDNGIKCHNVGFGEINIQDELYSIERKKYAVLLYHPSLDKNYEFGVYICNELFKRGVIDGVLTFGVLRGYLDAVLPCGLIRHYSAATKLQIEYIFKSSKLFIMPSLSEGLNMTPVEATLRGCPSVLCDGAIGDIYFNGETCLIADKNNHDSFIKNSLEILCNDYSQIYCDNMKSVLKNFTWDKTVSKIESLL